MKFKHGFICSRMSADNRLSLILLSHFLDIFRSITAFYSTGKYGLTVSTGKRLIVGKAFSLAADADPMSRHFVISGLFHLGMSLNDSVLYLKRVGSVRTMAFQ